MSNDVIEVKTLEDREFEALVSDLVSKFPGVESPGFDLTKLKGNLNRRSSKATVLQLHLNGWSTEDIAKAVGISPQTVADNLISAIREAAPLDDVEDLRELMMRRIGARYKECLDEWRRSRDPKVTRVVVGGEMDDEGNISEKITTKTESRIGDHSYQRLMNEMEKLVADLYGLKKPSRIEVDKTTRQMILTEVIVRSPAEVEAAKIAGLLK